MFVDQDVDYAALADRLDGVAPGVPGAHFFFDKVAPLLRSDLLAPAPPVGQGLPASLWLPAFAPRSSGERLPGCGLAAWLAGRYWRRVPTPRNGDRFFPICVGFPGGCLYRLAPARRRRAVW